MFEKTRKRLAQRRIRRDRELIGYGASRARHYEFTPVRCAECDTFGPVAGAVAVRTEAGNFTVLDWRCAREKKLHVLPLAECVQRAAELGIELSAPRQRGYIDVGPVETAAMLYNAQTKTFTASHAAMVGSGVKPGAPIHFKG
ncbi:hypothetical protein YUYDRAFT_01857 [Streptomyces sp. ScaeMP-e48]|uniref:hypothetical protein n=1 Tax=Streptomyces sp. ScaeMP-e48 TaxID=1100823 RepID=UPI000823B8FF|nr:hypothetical protein [Streptomyces sp. ScaeMP-e48]SCK18528.1 hypothetical protein YUYDRAFT_01857 [Streptomyces sp. ScaeMP-e48]